MTAKERSGCQKETKMKPDLRDCTFIIPFYADSMERAENLLCILRFLLDNFDTNIILVESAREPSVSASTIRLPGLSYLFMAQDIPGIFHRTKVINAGIKASNTPFISIYDTDVVFEPKQISDSVYQLRSGQTVVYPYAGDFVDIAREYIITGEKKEHQSIAKESVGGAVFLNREAYISAGMENERLISHAPEDVERYYRMRILGHNIVRMGGKCWHITHARTLNSGPTHPYVSANMAEFNKVKKMGIEELQAYITTWEWVK